MNDRQVVYVGIDVSKDSGAWQFCWWFFWEIKFKRNRIGRLALPSVGLLAFWPTGFRLLPG